MIPIGDDDSGRRTVPLVTYALNTSTKTLPEGYAQSSEINLKTNKRLAITLNIVACFVTVISFYLLSGFAALVRPGITILSGSITAGGVVFLMVLVVIFLTIHELIHGFFFWVFTRSRPVFAIRLFYAYAGAPAWYIPIRQYAVVAVGPLVIIDAVGLLLMLLFPGNWVLIIAFIVALNTGFHPPLQVISNVFCQRHRRCSYLLRTSINHEPSRPIRAMIDQVRPAYYTARVKGHTGAL
jgi:hypothetical protein